MAHPDGDGGEGYANNIYDENHTQTAPLKPDYAGLEPYPQHAAETIYMPSLRRIRAILHRPALTQWSDHAQTRVFVLAAFASNLFATFSIQTRLPVHKECQVIQTTQNKTKN
jgi:hypothetical protein